MENNVCVSYQPHQIDGELHDLIAAAWDSSHSNSAYSLTNIAHLFCNVKSVSQSLSLSVIDFLEIKVYFAEQ